jgi:hypothetical protein
MFWLAALALAAQTTTAPQQQTATPKTPEKVTITGCVERADQMAADGTLGTTVDSLHFVLRDVPEGPVGTTGTKGVDKGFRLDADVEKLNPHVGHKVEIIGFVEEPAATTPATSATGPMVKVDAIKMLSETCGRNP